MPKACPARSRRTCPALSRRALLFDVDMTLLWSGGAGSRAMNLAFAQLFGVADAFAQVEFSGRTDIAIFRDGLRLHGIDGHFEALLEEFKARYFRLLPTALAASQGRLMPGVGELLEALRGRQGVRLGLATGNFRQGAQLKLRHYGIDHYFCGGAYGDDAEERAEIVRLAVERILGPDSDRWQVIVIGDTPYDIAAAKANGALAVGVASGYHSLEQLRAAGADLLFPDFSDWQTAAATLLRK